jgi:hypothetical protein
VIRDHRGSMKLAGHGHINDIQSPEMGEAMAVTQALTIARYKDFTSIVLASDWLSLIQKMQATGMECVHCGRRHQTSRGRVPFVFFQAC